MERLANQHLGVEEHADRNKKQHRESIPERQRFFGGPVAQRRLAHDHAGEKSAESEGDAEQSGGTVGDADGGGDDAQSKKFARAGARDLPEQPRENPPADNQHERDKDRDLAEREREVVSKLSSAAPGVIPLITPSHSRKRRQ